MKKRLTKAWNKAFGVETIQENAFHTLSLMNSTYSFKIWENLLQAMLTCSHEYTCLPSTFWKGPFHFKIFLFMICFLSGNNGFMPPIDLLTKVPEKREESQKEVEGEELLKDDLHKMLYTRVGRRKRTGEDLSKMLYTRVGRSSPALRI